MMETVTIKIKNEQNQTQQSECIVSMDAANNFQRALQPIVPLRCLNDGDEYELTCHNTSDYREINKILDQVVTYQYYEGKHERTNNHQKH